MTFSNWDDINHAQKDILVSGYKVFMQKDFRLVIAPNGEMICVTPKYMKEVPEHLSTWSLRVSDLVLDL